MRLFSESYRRSRDIVLRRLERYLSRAFVGRSARPVFIIGPPRSGTTLFYQCYVELFRPAYISNLCATWTDGPLTASTVTRLLRRIRRCEFDNSYGATSGIAGPHEGWTIWNRWFKEGQRGDFCNRGELDVQARLEIQSFVNAIEQVYGQHFVTKNVKNSLRVLALQEMFPECVFIVLQRDLLSNAQSLLLAWNKHSPASNTWWSVKPTNYNEYRAAPNPERACKQLYYTEQHILHAIQSLGCERFLTINYESLCRDPHQTMEQVGQFLRDNGHSITKVGRIPERFDVHIRNRLQLNELVELKTELTRLYGCETMRAAPSEYRAPYDVAP